MHYKQRVPAIDVGHKQVRASPNRWLFINLSFAVVLIIAGIGMLFWLDEQPQIGQAQSSTLSSLERLQTAPNFTLTALNGAPVQLSDYAGQVVMINMWATWCPPCKAEMPTIHNYYQAHQEDGFVVLAVNSQESADDVTTFIQANDFTFPVLLDHTGETLKLYNVRGLPTSFIIDRNGAIRHTHTGEITWEQLDQIVGPLL